MATGNTIDKVLIGRNHTLFLHHHLLLKGGNETWRFDVIVQTFLLEEQHTCLALKHQLPAT
jgi:hypothetical protein